MLIHKRILAVLRFATTPDDTRYALNSYGLGPDGSICATDGHLMLYSEKPADAPPEDFPVLPNPFDVGSTVAVVLPVDAADAAVRAIKKTQSIPVLDHIAVAPANGDPHVLRVAATDLNTPFDTTVHSEGQFPAWRKVVPTKEPTLTVHLGADMLIAIGRAAKVATKGSGSTGPVVKFEFTGKTDSDPIRITFSCEVGSEVHGVVMPCRP